MTENNDGLDWVKNNIIPLIQLGGFCLMYFRFQSALSHKYSSNILTVKDHMTSNNGTEHDIEISINQKMRVDDKSTKVILQLDKSKNAQLAKFDSTRTLDSNGSAYVMINKNEHNNEKITQFISDTMLTLGNQDNNEQQMIESILSNANQLFTKPHVEVKQQQDDAVKEHGMIVKVLQYIVGMCCSFHHSKHQQTNSTDVKVTTPGDEHKDEEKKEEEETNGHYTIDIDILDNDEHKDNDMNFMGNSDKSMIGDDAI